jgi:hypothetical protein
MVGWTVLYVVKADEVNLFAVAVFGDFEQIQDSQESGRAGQFRRDIRKADLLDRVHFDLAFFHAISPAHTHMRSRPYPDAASNVPAPNPITKALGEHHLENSSPALAGRQELPASKTHIGEDHPTDKACPWDPALGHFGQVQSREASQPTRAPVSTPAANTTPMAWNGRFLTVSRASPIMSSAA